MVALRGPELAATREHGEVPLGSVFVEAEDVKGTVAALDFAIAVIGTVPLVEDFDDLDPFQVQTKRLGYLNPLVLTGLDLDAHVSASAAAQALSKPCQHGVEGGFSWTGRGLLVHDPFVSSLPTKRLQTVCAPA
jgi:hypothetical protein